MALSFLANRSLRNAFGRVLRDPRQLTAILFLALNPAVMIFVVVMLFQMPIPANLLRLSESLLPGGIAARLQGVRATITVLLLGLIFSALLNNRLIQFGQADIDLLFPTPTPSWRMLIGRILNGHIRALAAAFFFWGMGIVPLLRLGGGTIWPISLWGLVGLTCAFATVDQLGAALLLRISGAEGVQRLLRGLAISQWIVIASLAIAAGTALLAGLQAASNSLILVWSIISSTLLAPIGLATDLLLLPINHDPLWIWRLLAILALDLISASLVMTAAGGIQELALSPLGRVGVLRRALRRVWNPFKFTQIAWNIDQVEDGPEGEGGIPAFGSGAFALTWVRLIETRRQSVRALVTMTILVFAPLAIILRNNEYNLSSLLMILIFSTSLGTQAVDDLRGHLATADTDLALPISRWRLVVATLLGRLPIYWGSGLLLLLGVGIFQHGAHWNDLLLLMLWYPLQIAPLIGLRGALLFIFPQATLPSGSDPIQFALYTAFQGIVTALLLVFSFIPIFIAVELAKVLTVGPLLIWGSLFGTDLLLTIGAFLALGWAYQRFEPREGS